MTDGVTEMPTTTMRWRRNEVNNRVLQQLWHIQTCKEGSTWTLKEEWRDVPNEVSTTAAAGVGK